MQLHNVLIAIRSALTRWRSYSKHLANILNSESHSRFASALRFSGQGNNALQVLYLHWSNLCVALLCLLLCLLLLHTGCTCWARVVRVWEPQRGVLTRVSWPYCSNKFAVDILPLCVMFLVMWITFPHQHTVNKLLSGSDKIENVGWTQNSFC